MPHPNSPEPFIAQPRSSALLASLLVLMGVAFVSGIVPTSPNHTYFPGHEWVIAAGCWILALFFAYCAMKGLILLSRKNKK